jgi:hypothetical protein
MIVKFRLRGPIAALKDVAHLTDPNLKGALEQVEVAVANGQGALLYEGLTYIVGMPDPIVEDVSRITYRGLGLAEAVRTRPELKLVVSAEDRKTALEQAALLEQMADVLRALVHEAQVEG